MTYHVYSTLANSQLYTKYADQSQSNINTAERSVLVQGGSGVAKKTIGTPLGVYNSVSDEDMEWLKDEPTFKMHIANGKIRVEKRKLNPEVVAADMENHNRKTDACPIVPQEFNDKPAAKEMTALTPTLNRVA